MSLVAAALRIASVEAIRGKTYAGDAVYDAPLDPFDLAMGNERAPTVAVYSGTDRGETEGRDLLATDRKLEISFQIMLPTSMTVPSASGDKVLQVRGSGAEPVLDLICRSILRALTADNGPWSELWRSFVIAAHDVVGRPYIIEADGGVRIAAREMTISLDALAEPMFETPDPTSPWGVLLSLMRASPDLIVLADVFDYAFQGGPELSDWERAKASLGLTFAAADAIGLVPQGDGANVTEWTVETPAGDPELTVDGGTV